jgi:hypothetical protein
LFARERFLRATGVTASAHPLQGLNTRGADLFFQFPQPGVFGKYFIYSVIPFGLLALPERVFFHRHDLCSCYSFMFSRGLAFSSKLAFSRRLASDSPK